MTDTTALAQHLDDVVARIPGVTAVYSATPAIVNAVTQLALAGAPASRVSVAQGDGGLTVTASIGVDPDAQAPAVAAAVAAAVVAEIGGNDPATVTVRVSRVAPD